MWEWVGDDEVRGVYGDVGGDVRGGEMLCC